MGIIVLALVALFINLPLFLSDGLMATYDIFFHAIWAEQFQNALADGVVYPRWVDTPFGYGSPTFIFYAPLSFYVISAIDFFVRSHIFSIKIAIYLSFFLSGLSMYFFAKKLYGGDAALASAIVYELLPYHISELFMRGSVPALFAFIWFPLILLFMREICLEKKNSSIILMGFAYAGLILTHLASAFMFTLVMMFYGLYLSVIKNRAGTVRIFPGILIGIGLSSAYLLPVIFERVFVHIDVMKSFNYLNNFLFMRKNLLQEPLNAIAFLDILFFLMCLICLKKKFLSNENSLFVFLSGLGLFLAIPASALIWKYIPGFSDLQFPWRWLAFSGLSIAVLSGHIFYKADGISQKTISLIVVVMLSLSVYKILKPFPLADIDFWKTQSVAFAPFEYRPIWVNNPKAMLPPVEKVTIENGNGRVDIVDWKSNYRLLSVISEKPARLRLSTFYYPGWEAKTDGRRSDIVVHQGSGSMIIDIPEGNHTLEIAFRDTTLRYYGKIISMVSLILSCSFLILLRRRKYFVG